jgi:hypothetical protein
MVAAFHARVVVDRMTAPWRETNGATYDFLDP